MYWLHLTKKQKKRITQVLSTAEIQDPFADQSESLHWTALMITGTAETAMRSVIDATGLAETRSREFRDWLVLWAHLATCRAALNALRSSIHEAAKRYVGWACSHKNHEPLSWVEVRRLQDLDTGKVAEQLDVLARAVLVLHGCHRASFEDCTLLLDVPLQTAVGAYCTAHEWFNAFTKQADRDATDAIPATYSFRCGLNGHLGCRGDRCETTLDAGILNRWGARDFDGRARRERTIYEYYCNSAAGKQ